MIGLNKKRKMYLSPRTSSAEVDLEGLICGSEVWMNVVIEDLEHIHEENSEEPMYFGS